MMCQWMPQLKTCERYEDQKQKDFQWTWDDVNQADVEELRRYYRGIGYDDIPPRTRSETNNIMYNEDPMDDDEREMAAFEHWMHEVYDETLDTLLFDDKDFMPTDNIQGPDYTPRITGEDEVYFNGRFQTELKRFEREHKDMDQEWRDQYASMEDLVEDLNVTEDDPEGQALFRGHLIVACSPEEKDIDDAARIAKRCEKEFGRAVITETRVLGHARKEDNVFEVWLESYDIDLLHSRRQAFINPQGWTGPPDVDDEQLERLVEEMRFLLSDEFRSSYRYSDYADIEA